MGAERLVLVGMRSIAAAAAIIVAVGIFAGCGGASQGNPDAGPNCAAGANEPAELVLGTDSYPSGALAQDALRSDISTQGLEYPDQYGPRLDATLQRHRVGEILMQVGFALRDVVHEPSGDYQAQVANLFGQFTTYIDSVIAVGGRVRIQIHCSTPQWLARHPYSHDVLSGEDKPSGQPVWACSAPIDLADWRAIMRGVGEHFGAYAGGISFSIGSEPENYFVGTRDELFDWYAATASGILDSTNGASFRLGGLTFVTHTHAALSRTAPTLQQNKVTFTSQEYAEPITKTWIEHSAGLGLPLDLVTLHQFGGSPVPALGTYWGRARRDISTWLAENSYQPEQVEVLIEDWPQWAPYTSNDTEYFAAHMASGIISMLDLSLREGAWVRPLQGFLFDFGFRPAGSFPAGFAGRAGLSTEKGIIKPVFNLNSLLAEIDGRLTPVQSSDPFVHAIAATGPSHATLLVVNQVPLEYQIDLKYNYWVQIPIRLNHFVAEDLTGISYDLKELLDKFFGGVMPPWEELFDAFLADPSSIDLEQLSWPDEIKAQWNELRRFGRLARPKRACNTTAELALDGLPAGSYRYEHYVIDSQHANPYRDRELLEQRLKLAESEGMAAFIQEVLSINQEYDAESGKLDDEEILLEQPRAPVLIDMEPNSVHLLRFTAVP
jgi:hypothetical protein